MKGDLENGVVGVFQQHLCLAEPQRQSILDGGDAIDLLEAADKAVLIDIDLICQRVQIDLLCIVVGQVLVDPHDGMIFGGDGRGAAGIHQRVLPFQVQQQDTHNVAAHFLKPLLRVRHLCHKSGKPCKDQVLRILKGAKVIAVDAIVIHRRSELKARQPQADIFHGRVLGAPLGVHHIGVDNDKIHKRDRQLFSLHRKNTFAADAEKQFADLVRMLGALFPVLFETVCTDIMQSSGITEQNRLFQFVQFVHSCIPLPIMIQVYSQLV